MGAGYALGDDPIPISTFSARVGRPLATTRAEAASLLQLLLDLRVRDCHQVNLLTFVDCLVLLDIPSNTLLAVKVSESGVQSLAKAVSSHSDSDGVGSLPASPDALNVPLLLSLP